MDRNKHDHDVEIDDNSQENNSSRDSSDHESDYAEGPQKSYIMTVNNSLEKADINFQNSNRVHPFLQEWVNEEKRRNSSNVANREMILNYAASVASKDNDARSNLDLNETYMMFGGEDYLKV